MNPEGFNVKQQIEKEMNSAFKNYSEFFGLDADDLESKKTLDVGAGSAFFTQYVREKLHNTEAYALDMLKRRKDNPEWFICQDAQDTHLPDESFDLITAKSMFPMFIQPEYPTKSYGIEMDYKNFIEEMLRILKPGGTLMFDISTPEGIIKLNLKYSESEEETQKIKNKAENCKIIIDYLNSLNSENIFCELIPKKSDGYIVKIIKLLA